MFLHNVINTGSTQDYFCDWHKARAVMQYLCTEAGNLEAHILAERGLRCYGGGHRQLQPWPIKATP